eukprot:13782201-Alexandrium_andersonii.AAC.1
MGIRGSRSSPRVRTSAQVTTACPLLERASGPRRSQRTWTRKWATSRSTWAPSSRPRSATRRWTSSRAIRRRSNPRRGAGVDLR